MARKKAEAADRARRLLSLWAPPAQAGKPVGVLATTFTLDAGLFEEECLARFAGVQSDPARDGALYRIEREEKLASLLCATVVADIHHCAGRRSLRWDLLASRPDTGVMHAKISLLAWERHVRVIVASANLTTEGYRRNQECAAVLEFDAAFTDRALLDPVLVFLREILETTSGAARERALRLLAWVDDNLPEHTASPRGLQRRLVLVGPGRRNLFDQLDQHLPETRPYTANVVSPFFDLAPRPDGPEARLWNMLRLRGDAELKLHVAGEHAAETGTWRLQMPEHILASLPKGRPGVRLSLHPVAVTDVPTESGRERRPLHAKSLTLEHPAWTAWVVGSSNFTSAGTGMINRGRNYEANVLYFLAAPADDAAYRLLAAGGLRGGEAVGPQSPVDFTPAFAGDSEPEGMPALPAFFAEAILQASSDHQHELALRFAANAAPATWRLRHDGAVVYDGAAWAAAGRPGSVSLALARGGPPPSLLTVEWTLNETVHLADWSVNVGTVCVLPPPEELRGLSLAALLEILSSARPLHEVMKGWLRRQSDDDDADGFQDLALVDPHQKVDTSGFLVKRVQRACGAMTRLRERLEAPLLSEAALAWRLDGPVGARAVIHAMREQCDPALPDEWIFLLCEMVRELAPIQVRGGSDAIVQAGLQARLDAFVAEMKELLAEAVQSGSAPLKQYVQMGLEIASDVA